MPVLELWTWEMEVFEKKKDQLSVFSVSLVCGKIM